MLHRLPVPVNRFHRGEIRWADPTKAASSAYIKGVPPPAVNAQLGRSVGAVKRFVPGKTGAAWLPRPATAPVMVGRAERISQDLAGGNSGHDDHGADCHILEDHRHALVAAILRHHLGL